MITLIIAFGDLITLIKLFVINVKNVMNFKNESLAPSCSKIVEYRR
jgi:hypothetical protein